MKTKFSIRIEYIEDESAAQKAFEVASNWIRTIDLSDNFSVQGNYFLNGVEFRINAQKVGDHIHLFIRSHKDECEEADNAEVEAV